MNGNMIDLLAEGFLHVKSAGSVPAIHTGTERNSMVIRISSGQTPAGGLWETSRGLVGGSVQPEEPKQQVVWGLCVCVCGGKTPAQCWADFFFRLAPHISSWTLNDVTNNTGSFFWAQLNPNNATSNLVQIAIPRENKHLGRWGWGGVKKTGQPSAAKKGSAEKLPPAKRHWVGGWWVTMTIDFSVLCGQSEWSVLQQEPLSLTTGSGWA